MPGRKEHAKPLSGRLRRAADVARSSASRYPKDLLHSLLNPRANHRDDPGEPREPFVDPGLEAPLAAMWLGHATVLVRLGGMWVLTDPVFSNRIGISLGRLTMGVHRLTRPPVDADRLPPIDLILLSHAHFDHLDKPTLRRLARPSTTVVTASSTAGLVPRGFGDVRELRWDRSLSLGPIQIHALRPNHWGARTAWDRFRGYNSYVVETPQGRVLYAGDTAMTDAFKRVGGVDLSVFGIGAYDPWIEMHANPEQVWAMHEHAGGKYLLPMHHSTFRLSNEPGHEPLQRLLAAAGTEQHRVVAREAGRLWLPDDAPRATADDGLGGTP